MSEELDPAVAENLASGAMRFLLLTPGNKILCTKRQLQECLVTLAREAYAMGFLSGQKEDFSSLVLSGAAQRPAWMEIRLDDAASLARHGFRMRPVVVRSLIGAGYRELGDLCWASDHELRKILYIGRKTARQIRTIVRELQTRSPAPMRVADGSPKSASGSAAPPAIGSQRG
jgi:hypothetical protein